MLDEIVRRVVEAAQLDRVILFGSAARGDMGPHSDVDLLLIKSGVKHRGQVEERIYMKLFGVDVPVDVVVVTPEDVARIGDRVGSVIRPALREGQEIYAALATRPRPPRVHAGRAEQPYQGPRRATRAGSVLGQ